MILDLSHPKHWCVSSFLFVVCGCLKNPTRPSRLLLIWPPPHSSNIFCKSCEQWGHPGRTSFPPLAPHVQISRKSRISLFFIFWMKLHGNQWTNHVFFCLFQHKSLKSLESILLSLFFEHVCENKSKFYDFCLRFKHLQTNHKNTETKNKHPKPQIPQRWKIPVQRWKILYNGGNNFRSVGKYFPSGGKYLWRIPPTIFQIFKFWQTSINTFTYSH